MRSVLVGSFLAWGILAPGSASATGDAADAAEQPFRDAWEAMANVDALTYFKVVDSNIPGIVSGSTVQTGTYEISTATGIGSFVLEPGRAAEELLEMPLPGHDGVTFEEAMELIGGQRFELRLVGGIFWQGIPQPEGLTWIGAAVDDMPYDVSGAFDGVALLDGAFTSTDLNVVRQDPADGAGTDWTVSVDADLVGPLGAQTGTNERLLESGFDGETDGRTQVLVHADAAGVVTHVSADLSDWWVDAISEADAAAGDMLSDIDVRLDVRFAVPDGPLDVVAPCTDSETETQQGVETLICPVGG